MHYAGHAVTKVLKLPPRTTEFTVHRGLRVPMRDGVHLLADHYEPATTSPAGTILLRGPYGRGFPFSMQFARVYASRGYHVVFQSVRGTFGSGGDFTPMVNEIGDGADTAAWLRDRPWFTGSFATVGLSYLGFTQWALLTDPPPEMKAAVITVGPHDLSSPRWGTGSFSLNDFLGWSDMVAHQEDSTIRTIAHHLRARRALATATSALPVGEAGRALLGTGAPWYESWLGHPDHDDPHWARQQLHQALERTQIPVLLLSGWQDLFLEQTLAQYKRLRERDVPVAATIGPWTHTQMMTKGAPRVVRESLEWLGGHLAGNGTVTRTPMRIYIIGRGWQDLDHWPPAMPERALYLQSGGRLGEHSPAADTPAPSFTFDPADPTPTVGGRLLSPEGGYRNDTRLAQRADVLTFTGDQLPADLYVIGTPVLELSHSCDNPHNDVFVRISEVDAWGRSRNVSDGYLCAPPNPRNLRIELDGVAHRFRAGSRIRLLIAGGSHPRFARNLGTGEPMLSGRRVARATHSVHLGEGGTSRLTLPAGPRLPS
ncbi:MAG: CocE/NonD family hydrolase [Mycobacterium sp.]